MKNLRIIYLFTVLLAFAFSGCQKEYEDLYRVTNYPTFKMTGDKVVFNTFGTNFTDPGIKASEAGKDIPATTIVSGDFFGATSFNANITDRYLFTYIATNSDGYKAQTSRLVYNIKTGNLVDNIEGLYTSTVVRGTSTGPQYTNMKYVLISKSGANTYKLSDLLGGWYEFGRALGAGYRTPGMTITATNIPGNIFSFSPATLDVGTFGGPAKMISMNVDSATKTIAFVSEWITTTGTKYTFKVTLKQVQL